MKLTSINGKNVYDRRRGLSDMTRRDRLTVSFVLCLSLSIALVLSLLPAKTANGIELFSGVIIMPLMIFRLGSHVLYWYKNRKHGMVVFGTLLILLLSLGFLGELGKLTRCFF